MIRLRKLCESDAASICRAWTGAQPLPGYLIPEDEARTAELIAEWNRGEARETRFEMLLIERNGQPAGLLSLLERGRDASLGISVHPTMQRQGIGAEAVRQAAEFAQSVGWDSLVSECRADNAASIALHEKCGFEQTGSRVNRKGNRVIVWRLTLKKENA